MPRVFFRRCSRGSARPEHAALQAEVDAALSATLDAQGDAFLPSEHYLKKWGYEVDARGATPSDPWPR